MKYRRLTKEEFEALHEDFIYFLSANTITGDDWKKIKAETPEKAEQLLNMFSDIAWEKVLEKSEYVERIGEREWMSAHFGEQSAHMVLLRSTTNEPIPNEVKASEIKSALKNKTLELVQGTKKYSKLREQEMFQLIQQGANPSKGEKYITLKGLLK